MSNPLEKVARKAEKRGIPNIKRHVFFCGHSGCCKDHDEAKSAARVLSRAAKQSRESEAPFEMTPVECLSLCVQGPLCVVYPEGIWYAQVDEKAARRIVEEHLQGGKIVEELVFARSGTSPEESAR